MAERNEHHEATKSKERGGVQSLGSSSDEDLDVEAFIDQEFDSIAYYTDDEMSEMYHVFEDFEARANSTMTDHESSDIASQHLDGVSAQADGGFMVGESNASKEETIGTVRQSSAEQRMEQVRDMYNCEVCPQCKSPSRKSFHDRDGAKSVQNGRGAAHGRDAVVSEEQISDISEEVGMCWKELGPKLRIKASKIHNIDEEYRTNRDKASHLLLSWTHAEGCAATVGMLEAALLSINRRDIAETLLSLAGVTELDMEPERRTSDSVFQPPDSLNLSVTCNLKVNSPNPVLLCVNEKGEKYLAKKIDGETETPWDVMEILDNEKLLEKLVTALTDRKKTKEQRRQESLKRASKEIEQLRKRLKRAKLDPDQDKKESEEIYEEKPEEVETEVSKDDLEILLANCERQCDNLQGMFNGLIKVIGEVGPLDGNNLCLKQLCDFTKELQGQEKQFFPQIYDISLGKHQLTASQTERLEVLQKWQRAQKEQVDGIEKLLTSLMDQGRIKRKKLVNRRSEPIFGRIWHPGVRRRAKTDSAGTKSLSEIREEYRKDNISDPMCPRQMCVLERQTVKAKTKSLKKNS